MSLTKEQAIEKAHRAIALEKEINDVIDPGIKRAMLWMLFWLVIGIFFFPCLVIALICFCLNYFGKQRKDALSKEIQEITTTLTHEIQSLDESSEVRIALTELIGQQSQP